MAVSDENIVKLEIESILNDIAKVKNIQNYGIKANSEAQLGDGFISQFYRGEIIDKNTGGILNVAIKKAPRYDFDVSKIFRNERTFYEKLIPALQALQNEISLPDPFDNIPEYFTAGVEARKEFIALEDLTPKGYVLHDKKKNFDKQHLELIFRIYGKFHALSFVLRKKNFEKYQKIHQDYSDLFSMMVEADAAQSLYVDVLTAAVDSLDPDSAVYEVAKDIPKNTIPTILKLFKYDGENRCSIHGDCWSNNMLFKYSDSEKVEDIKLIDFQVARDGTPVHDLSYFFYSGAGKEDFDIIEDYLKIYHNSLSEVITKFGENPNEILPFDVLIKEWKENALMGVFLGIYLWQIKLTSKEDYVDLLKECGDRKLEEVGEEFGNIMARVCKSEIFRKKARDILTHAFEYGILRKDKIVYKEDKPLPLEPDTAQNRVI